MTVLRCVSVTLGSVPHEAEGKPKSNGLARLSVSICLTVSETSNAFRLGQRESCTTWRGESRTSILLCSCVALRPPTIGKQSCIACLTQARATIGCRQAMSVA